MVVVVLGKRGTFFSSLLFLFCTSEGSGFNIWTGECDVYNQATNPYTSKAGMVAWWVPYFDHLVDVGREWALGSMTCILVPFSAHLHTTQRQGPQQGQQGKITQ